MLGFGSSTPLTTAKNNKNVSGDRPIPAETEKVMGAALNKRQVELNRKWMFYACTIYEGRKVDWNGKPYLEHLEKEAVASSTNPPADFNNDSYNYPLKYRRPTCPYYLVRSIVDKFTGLVFSKKRCPIITVVDDKVTEEWITEFIKQTRFWSKMMLARTYGGAMGSVGIGFKFVNGKPIVEVHDPRWCFVEFEEDDDEQKIARFEKRYLYTEEVRDKSSGIWKDKFYWYRRVIDDRTDTVWHKIESADGKEPDWDDLRFKPVEREHGFGFVPVVWVQNHMVQNDLEGWTDAEGQYDTTEAIDRLYAQADRGATHNCDPTTVISSDAFSGAVRKGSNNALMVEKGGSANYMEITGVGIESAMSVAKELRGNVLEVAHCVLDTNFEGPARTEEEVIKNYSSMLETADKLRGQYGAGIIQLIDMVLDAVRTLSRPLTVVNEDGSRRTEKRVVRLKPKITTDEDGKIKKVERELGRGELIELSWPPYAEPGIDATLKATQAASAAKLGKLVDQETAVRHVAKYFGIEDTVRMVQKIEEESANVDEVTLSRLTGLPIDRKGVKE